MSSLLNRWKLNQDLGISNEIENTDGEFSKGVSRAWENTKATTKAAIGAMGAEDFLMAADFNQREAQKYAPKVGRFTDIGSFSDAGNWLAGTAGESVVDIGTILAGGGVGGVAARGAAKMLGSTALKRATRAGTIGGLVASSYPQQFGENIQAVRAEHGGALPEGSVPTMALTAVAQTALDTLPVMGVLGRLGLADKARGDILQKTLTSPTRIRQIGRDLGGLALKEGVTEATQEAMKLGALEWIDSNKDHFGIEQMKQLVDSFAAGAVGGTMLGAPVAGLNALHSDKPRFRKAAKPNEESASELLALPSPDQVMAHPDDVYRVDKSGTTSVAPPTNVELVSKIRKDADGNIIQERHPLLALPAQVQPHPDDVYAVDNAGNIVGYAPPAKVELKRTGMADREDGSILGLKPLGYESVGELASESVNSSSLGLNALHSDKPWFRRKEVMKARAIKRFEESGNIEQFENDKDTIRGFIAQQLEAEARQPQSVVEPPAPSLEQNLPTQPIVIPAPIQPDATADIPLENPPIEQNTTEIGRGIPEPKLGNETILGGLPINNVSPPSSPPLFTPTHELPDGTPVVAHPEDAGVWVGADGGEYESGQAYAITEPSDQALEKEEEIITTGSVVETGRSRREIVDVREVNGGRVISARLTHYLEADGKSWKKRTNSPVVKYTLGEWNRLTGTVPTVPDAARMQTQQEVKKEKQDGGAHSINSAVRGGDSQSVEILDVVPNEFYQSKQEPEVKAQFADNKIFTQSAVDAARARLKKKLSGTLNSGFDPEIMADGLVLGGAYIESGLRGFGEWSRAMIADVGSGVKPYLLSFYEGARHFPGLDTKGMDTAAEAAAQHAALMVGKQDEVKADEQRKDQDGRDVRQQQEPEKLGGGDTRGTPEVQDVGGDGGKQLRSQPRVAAADSKDVEAGKPDDVGKSAERGAGISGNASVRGAGADVAATRGFDEVGDDVHGRDGAGGKRGADVRVGTGRVTKDSTPDSLDPDDVIDPKKINLGFDPSKPDERSAEEIERSIASILGKSMPKPTKQIKNKPKVKTVKAPETVSPANLGAGNYHIVDPLALVGGGAVSRFDKAEAAGDPRILIREKLKKKIGKLQEAERMHTLGVADARRSAKSLRDQAARDKVFLDGVKSSKLVEIVQGIVSANAGKGFSMVVAGKTLAKRDDAKAAIDTFVAANVRADGEGHKLGTFGGYPLWVELPKYAFEPVLMLDVEGTVFEGKSIASLEHQLRSYEESIQKRATGMQQRLESATRADGVAVEPFRRGEELARAVQAEQDLLADIAANPVPPPSWLRSGAPAETEVMWHGKPFVVTGHRWNEQGWFVLAEDDKGAVVIPYTEAMDAQGMALYQEREFEKPDAVIEKAEKKAEAVDSSVRFSRTGSTVGSAKNTVVDEEESRALVEGFRRRFRGAIDIQVVDNFYGLPLAVLEAAHQQAFDPGEIRGVLHMDTVYLVRENHRSVAEVEATLFHEIYTHAGFRKLFGENLSKQFNHLFLALGGTQKIIERGAKHGHNLQVYWDSFEQAGYSNEDKRAALVDELFAHLSQNQANASFSQKALQLAKELYGAIRQWLREHGFKRLSETSDADIAYLLKQAREVLAKPTTPHDKGAPQFLRTPMFSRQTRESGFAASGENDLWSGLKAQAPKEGMARNKELLGKGWQWTKDHIQEVVKTGGLGLLTLRQLAEIGKDVVPAMQKYMALTERMLTARNQMADESGKLAQRWTKLDKAMRQKLAFVMHKATLERVDPSLDQVPDPEILIRVADLEWREKLGLARPASLLTEIEPERLAVNDKTLKLLRKRYLEANNKALRSRGQRERFEQLKQVANTLLADWKAAKSALQQHERALPVFERLQQQFRALSPEAQAIYTESRDMYEARFARKHQALIESINRSVMPDERKRALARTLQQEFESAKLQGVYFPLHRQGAYFVRGDVKKEQVSETVYFKKAGFERINRGTGEVTQEANTWDSEESALRSANSRSDLIGKDLIAVEQDGGWVLKENPSEPLFLMFPTAAEAEREAGRLQADPRYGGVRMGKLNKQNTQDELGRAGVLMQTMTAMKANNQDVPDEMYQLMLEMLPELSMRKNSIHRKGVQGFSADALNAFGHQMLHQAHQISKLEARDQLAQALRDIEEQAKLVPNQERMLAGNLREEMKKRHDWVMSPKNAAWTNWTSSFGFVMYLGVSPAAALVNLSQVAIVGYPALAAKYGWAEAAKTLNATARQLSLREVVLGDDAIARGVLSDDERVAMEHWHDMGVIDKSQAQMLAGVADNDALSNSPAYQRAMGRVAHLFHKAEVVNREVMLLSAYRLARAKGESYEQAVQYASDVTWETQFDYSNANRAGFMQNDFAKVALMFKSYSQHMIYFLLRNARQWGKGGADAKEARSKLLGILAVTLAMGGVSALPLGFVGAATGFAYAQAKFGTKAASIGTVGAVAGLMLLSAAVLDDEEDWESELRKALRSIGGEPLETLVFRGAVNLTTGVDLSSRINLDDLIVRESDRDLEGADAKGALLEQLAGPVVGYGVNALYTAPELWSQDHEWRAVEKLMPKFARDWMQTARFGTEGALTMKGSPIVEKDLLGLPYSDELNLWNLFWKANGFNAEKLTGQYVANNDFMNAKKRVQDSREKVLNRLFVASVENDREAVLEAKNAIKDWNQAHPRAKQINEAAMKRSLAARLRARRENDQGVRVQAAEVYLRE